MAGRPSKPTDMILLEGKSHRTKAELNHRKSAEQALYTGENFRESVQVKNNPIAHKEFSRLKKLYAKIAYIDALDQQVINRYCLEIANQIRLADLAEKLELKIDEINDNMRTSNIVALFKAISGVEYEIRKSKEFLLKFEDRLFLNPASRIRSVPKTPEKQAPESGIAAYRARRADR